MRQELLLLSMHKHTDFKSWCLCTIALQAVLLISGNYVYQSYLFLSFCALNHCSLQSLLNKTLSITFAHSTFTLYSHRSLQSLLNSLCSLQLLLTTAFLTTTFAYLTSANYNISSLAAGLGMSPSELKDQFNEDFVVVVGV